MKTIFYVAGKSGGHIIPALTLAQQQKAAQATTVGIFSTDAMLDKQLISSCTSIDHHISLPLHGVSFKHPYFFPKLVYAWLLSLRTLWRHRPEVVVSTGGMVSIPVCAAAWILRIPFEVYEFNVEPGSAAKFLAPYARKVHTCFDATKEYLRGNVISSPYPLRHEVAQKISMQQARERLAIPHDKKVLMIIGGSQGSRFFNVIAQQYIVQLSAPERTSLYIVHQTGIADAQEIREFYKESETLAMVFDYSDALALYYQAADYVVTRAGSGVLHELIFFDVPALIIPLEVATTSHQVANAQAFVQKNPDRWCMVRQHEFADQSLFYKLLQSKLF